MSALNLAFETELKNSRFSRFNTYTAGVLIDTRIHHNSKKDEYIPLICHRNSLTNHVDFIKMSTATQLRGRTITKDKAAEIINTAPYLITVFFAGKRVLLGKGFMGLYDLNTAEIVPLFVAMIKNKSTATTHDMIFYTAKLLKTVDFRHFEQTLLDFYRSHPGDIVITDNVYKYVGTKLQMPAFKSLGERAAYTNQLISASLDTVYGKEEEIIPTFAPTSVEIAPQDTFEIVDDALEL